MTEDNTDTRRPLISANWKMNLNHFEALKLVQELSYQISRDDIDELDISIHPPFTDLRTVQTTLESDKIPFFLGAQNCHFDTAGAFTGEVSPAMLAKLNVRYVIVGHSERRQIFLEEDEFINKKVKAVLASGMTPILCVGETLEQREAGEAIDIVKSQLSQGLKRVKTDDMADLVLAYEPIWAIGTGQTATAEEAQMMCSEIRSTIAEMHNQEIADQIIIQYGGSVKPTNASELMSQPDIDGFLVGGASLKADPFTQIVQYRLHDL